MKHKRLVYLDHAATTPLRAEAREAMLPYLGERFGNPSASYARARQAQRAVEDGRRTVAEVLGCRPSEVVFTSGGTESVNAAIKGVAFAQQLARLGNHIVTSAIEHHAVLHSSQYLEKFGFDVTYLPVDAHGLVDPAAVAEAVGPRTVLVNIMLANNEVGTIEPMAEIAQAVKGRARSLGRRVPLHTDAVQVPCSLDLNVDRLGVDLLSLSAHKFGGPKGAGVLYLRRAIPFLSQLSGGGQERQRRAGTENVAGIAGTAVALRLAAAEREAYARHCGRLRDRLVDGIRSSIPGAELSGHPQGRLPNNAHFTFEGVEGDALVAALDGAGIAGSAGSACTSSVWEPSHVLVAMSVPLSRAIGSLRLTVGSENTDEEIDYALSVLRGVVERLRALLRAGPSAALRTGPAPATRTS
jgi:cysteine desulfurase